MSEEVSVRIVPCEPGFSMPEYATKGSAGMDLKSVAEVRLNPGERKLISLGFSMEIPEGYEAQIRPRSGLAYKNGITVLNSPGTIDSDYRGVVHVLLINHSDEIFWITPGMRIAQMVIAPVTRVALVITEEPLSTTDRGEGGFGSTGLTFCSSDAPQPGCGC